MPVKAGDLDLNEETMAAAVSAVTSGHMLQRCLSLSIAPGDHPGKQSKKK